MPPKENEIDCEMVPYITCPWCGYKDRDSWEHNLADGEEEETECGKCGKKIWVECSISVDYTSRKEPRK